VAVFAVVDQHGFLLAVEAFVAAVAIVEEMVVMMVAIAPVMAGAVVAIAVQGEAVVTAGLGLAAVA